MTISSAEPNVQVRPSASNGSVIGLTKCKVAGGNPVEIWAPPYMQIIRQTVIHPIILAFLDPMSTLLRVPLNRSNWLFDCEHCERFERVWIL